MLTHGYLWHVLLPSFYTLLLHKVLYVQPKWSGIHVVYNTLLLTCCTTQLIVFSILDSCYQKGQQCQDDLMWDTDLFVTVEKVFKMRMLFPKTIQAFLIIGFSWDQMDWCLRATAGRQIKCSSTLTHDVLHLLKGISTTFFNLSELCHAAVQSLFAESLASPQQP